MPIRTLLICSLLALLLTSCRHSDPASSSQGLVPLLTISSTCRPHWFLDDTLETILFPSTFDCVPGEMCITVSPGAWDYTCTSFPDTFWGLVFYDYTPTPTPPETLYCHSDTCWVRNDTVVYAMTHYFDSLSNAVCSSCARSYTATPLCYRLAAAEDTVTLFNACFDTTFAGVSIFCLPRLPLPPDTLPQGVYFASVDTFFCPATLINSHDDTLTRQLIINWTPSQ